MSYKLYLTYQFQLNDLCIQKQCHNKNRFIALMKSLDLNQQGQIIEGELDLKQELISQWKSH